ncbi:hypothetical protein AAVH_12910 [Aphelenchoides avenae]|nr:hypothetical protein AAVH_12910 [Aphelenchus avenae]
MNALYAILALFLALSHVEGHDEAAHIRQRRQLQLPPIIPARGQNDLFGVRPLNAGPGAGYNGPGPINFGNNGGGPQPINVGPGSNYANVQEPAVS